MVHLSFLQAEAKGWSLTDVTAWSGTISEWFFLQGAMANGNPKVDLAGQSGCTVSLLHEDDEFS